MRYVGRVVCAALVALSGCDGCHDTSGSSVDATVLPIAPCTSPDETCLGHLPVDGSPLELPYLRTQPLGIVQPGIRRAVVVLHGTDRDATGYFDKVVQLATDEGVLAETVVIAPHFQTTPTTSCSGTIDSPGASELYWSCNGWKHGDAALNAPVDSYAVLDALMSAVATTFPDIEQITVVGHSAGAQMAHRYAAANAFDGRSGMPPVRYVVANPSSYLYFDARRLTSTATCTATSCVLDASAFQSPYYDAASCASYDEYPYGLVQRYGYTAGVPDSVLRDQYIGRAVFQLLGELDSDTSTTAGYPDLDVTCGAMAEGPQNNSFRLSRGLVYHAYVTLLGAAHTVEIVPGCGHSKSCMFSSAAGRLRIFGP